MRHPMSRAIVPAALCGVGLIGLALNSFVSAPPGSTTGDEAADVIFVDSLKSGSSAGAMKSIRTPQTHLQSPVTLAPELVDAILDLPDGELVEPSPRGITGDPRRPQVPGLRSRAEAVEPAVAPALSLSLEPPGSGDMRGELDAIVASIENSLASRTAADGEPDWVTATAKGWRTLDEPHGKGGPPVAPSRDNWVPVDAIPATAGRLPDDDSAPAVFDFDRTDERAVGIRSRARALLIAARRDLQAGRLNAARLKALQAESLEAPYTVLDDRPDLVLNAVDRHREHGADREVPTPKLADWTAPAQPISNARTRAAVEADQEANPFLFDTDMELEPVAPPAEGESESPDAFQPFEEGEPDLLGATQEPIRDARGAAEPERTSGEVLAPRDDAPISDTGSRDRKEDAADRSPALASAAASGWHPLDEPAGPSEAEASTTENGTAQTREWKDANRIALELEAAVAERAAAARDDATNKEEQSKTDFDRFIAEHSRSPQTRHGNKRDFQEAASDELVPPSADLSTGDNDSTTPAEAPLFGSLVEGVAQEATAAEHENPFRIDDAQASTENSSETSDRDEGRLVFENPFLANSTDDGDDTQPQRDDQIEFATAASETGTEPAITATGLSRDAQRRWPVLELQQVRRDPRGQESATIVSIVVRNVSSAIAHGVTVESSVPAAWTVTGVIPQCRVEAQRLTWEIGTLQPGEERLVWLRVNEESPDTEQALTLVRYSANPSVEAFRDVEIEVSGNRSVRLGEPLSVRFRLQNRGYEDLANILIRDILPPLVAHPGGSDLSNEIPQLPAGRAAEMELQLTAVEPGRAVNHVTLITGDGQYVTGCMELVVLPPEN